MQAWLTDWHCRMEKVAANPNDSAYKESAYAAHALSLVLSEMSHLTNTDLTPASPAEREE